jgi:N-glycosidase YbiA
MNREERLAKDRAVDPILFYHPSDGYGIFSNFSKHPIVLPSPWTREPTLYRTTEHRYQAMKSVNQEGHDWVVSAATAYESKERGRQVDLLDDWGGDYRDPCFWVMFEALTAKVFQHSKMERTLARTLDRTLYEDSPVDDIWGWRFRNDYRGKNLLGRALMDVRACCFSRP